MKRFTVYTYKTKKICRTMLVWDKEHTVIYFSDRAYSNEMNLLSLPKIHSGEESDKDPVPTKTKWLQGQ